MKNMRRFGQVFPRGLERGTLEDVRVLIFAALKLAALGVGKHAQAEFARPPINCLAQLQRDGTWRQASGQRTRLALTNLTCNHGSPNLNHHG